MNPDPYPQPYYPQPAPLVRPTSGLATASMVLGILGLLLSWCTLGVPSIAAVVLGHMSRKQTRTGERAGHGQGTAGLILGYIVFIPGLVVTIMVVIGAASSPS